MEKIVLIQNQLLAKTPLYPEISIYDLNAADIDSSFFPRPEANQVYIWKIRVSVFNEKIQFLRKFLSYDEIDKADRYRFMEDASRFVVSRAILRLVCGSYLSVKPDKIIFNYGENGKPGIAGLYENGYFFNLSHSGDIVLVAFSCYENIGIDIELTRDMDDYESIALNCFHPSEADILTLLKRSTGELKLKISDKVLKDIAESSGGDARAALGNLDALIKLSGGKNITQKLAKELLGSEGARNAYDKNGDQHYDTISAFIKSMRASDGDAARYSYDSSHFFISRR